VKPRRPYLLRAMHEWICDSQWTPHIVVDAGMSGVEVPRHYVRDGKIVLNVSWTATAQLKLGNDEVSFSGRFGGTSMNVRVPMQAILAIYARETGQGMIFNEDEATPPPDGKPPEGPAPDKPTAAKSTSAAGRARFKVVK
jgi:stringent starvation protein B